MSKGGTQVTGIVLVVLGGLFTGGAWSFWQQPRRTAGVTFTAAVFAVVAALLVVAGVLRLA